MSNKKDVVSELRGFKDVDTAKYFRLFNCSRLTPEDKNSLDKFLEQKQQQTYLYSVATPLFLSTLGYKGLSLYSSKQKSILIALSSAFALYHISKKKINQHYQNKLVPYYEKYEIK